MEYGQWGDTGIKCTAILNNTVSTWQTAGKCRPMECTGKHGISKDLVLSEFSCISVCVMYHVVPMQNLWVCLHPLFVVPDNHSPRPGWEVLGRNPLRLRLAKWWTRLTLAWLDTRHSDLTLALASLDPALIKTNRCTSSFSLQALDLKQELLYCKDSNLV